MRVAAVYDIHGNLPALEAVLQEIESGGADALVVGGDVVPGPLSGECLDALDALSIPVLRLRGNCENDLLALADEGDVPARVPEAVGPVLRWVLQRLGPKRLNGLREWPATVWLPVPGTGDMLFCHATPDDDNQIFTRRTPEAVLAPVFEEVRAAVVVCGHTHMPFDRRIGNLRVVNPGSVGMPFGGTRACWAWIAPEIEFMRTKYDLDAAMASFHETGCPQAGVPDLHHPRDEEAMLDLFDRLGLGLDTGRRSADG